MVELSKMTRQEFETWIEGSRWIFLASYEQMRVYLTPGGGIIGVNFNADEKVSFVSGSFETTPDHQLRKSEG